MMRVGNEVLPIIWHSNPYHTSNKKNTQCIYYWVDEPVRASLVAPGSKEELYLFFRELAAGEGRIMLELKARNIRPDVSPSGAWRSIRQRWQRYEARGKLTERNTANTGETEDSDEADLIRKWVRDRNTTADTEAWVFLPSMANRGIVFRTLDVSADMLREYCLTNRRRRFRPVSEWSEWGVRPSWREPLDASEYPVKSKLKHAQAFRQSEPEDQGPVGKKRMVTKDGDSDGEERDDVADIARLKPETGDEGARHKQRIKTKISLSKKQVAKPTDTPAGEPEATTDLRPASIFPCIDIPTVSSDYPATLPRSRAPGIPAYTSDSYRAPQLPLPPARNGPTMYPRRSDDDSIPFWQREASVYHTSQMLYPSGPTQPPEPSPGAYGYASNSTSRSLQTMPGYHVCVRGFSSTVQSLRIFMDLGQNVHIVQMPDKQSFTIVIPDAEKAQDIIRDFKDCITQGVHISAEYMGFADGASIMHGNDLTGV